MTARPGTTAILDGGLVPPCDLDAEKGVLGSIVLKPDVLDDLKPILAPQAFYLDVHRKLYRHLVAMHDAGEQIDGTLLVARLRQAGDYCESREESPDGRLRIDAALLGDVVQAVPYARNAVYYAKIVNRMAAYRSIRLAGEDLLRAGQAATDEPAELIDRAEAILAGLRTDQHDGEPVSAANAVVKTLENIDAIAERQSATGYLTGLETFDRNIGGLFPGELFILAARPGMGKTSLACQIAYHFSVQGRGVYFASLEMSAVELTTRILCSRCGVSMRRVRTGQLRPEDNHELNEAAHPFHKAKLWLHDRPGLTTTEIRRSARRLQKHDLKLVVVDYLQRLTPSDRRISRHEQVGQMSDALKSLARELDVPVLCLCQLNRQVEQEKGAPKLSHLRESGSIEQDADVVAFLHATETADPDPRVPVKVELSILKNRNGETGKIALQWLRSRTMFLCGDEATTGGFDD